MPLVQGSKWQRFPIGKPPLPFFQEGNCAMKKQKLQRHAGKNADN
jgi:hypothetical protein